MEGAGASAATALEAGDQVLVLPAGLDSEIAEQAELAVGLEAEGLEGLGDHLLLLDVERVRASVVEGKTVEGSSTTSSLVRDHATKDTEEHLGRGTVMERSVLGVHVVGLTLESIPLKLLAVQRIRDVDLIATNDSHLLTLKKLLGNGRSKTSLQMTAPIDKKVGSEGHFLVFG